MSEALTTLFVVPTGNSLPTINRNDAIVGTQFGIYLPGQPRGTGVAATAITAASASCLQLVQGRNISSPTEGTRNSDFIYKGNIIEQYKVSGSLTVNNQITEISALNVGCNESVSITLRLFSFYINAAYANGLTRSVLVTTPCCNCGSNPCDTLSSEQIQAVMTELAQAINADELLSPFVTAGITGTGSSTAIIIEGNPLTSYGPTCDLTNFPYQYDKLRFYTFIRSGPELTTDYEVDDICNIVATVTNLQVSSYPQNTPAEVMQMEKDYFFNQANFGDIFSNVNYNPEFQTYVDSALAYNLYYLHFKEPLPNGGVMDNAHADEETVIIAIPAGDSSEAPIVAVLTAAFGPFTNETATGPTTTAAPSTTVPPPTTTVAFLIP